MVCVIWLLGPDSCEAKKKEEGGVLRFPCHVIALLT
jgi:hypothetical protein